MFEDSLFASIGQSYPRGWAALVSFAVQTLFVAALIAMPMLFTGAIPLRALRESVQISPALPAVQTESKPPIQPMRPEDTLAEAIQVSPNLPRVMGDPLFEPQTGRSSGPPNPPGIGEVGHGDSELFSLLNSRGPVIPMVERALPKRWRVSGGVEQGLLISNVKPVYPKIAREAGVQGDVVLQAVIGKDGRIENLHAVSGNSLLIQSALDAVQQWRYRPYLLNGQPVEVETQITVRFTVS
jgi:protein TonB